MRVAVVGAGWAGLAAAVSLHRNNHDVTVYESSKYIGGRARPINTPLFPGIIDNGQHILIGAYKSCFGLMQSLDVDIDKVLFKQTLEIQALDKSLKFKFLNLRTPFNRLGVLTSSHGLSGISGRMFFMRLFKSLQKELADIPVILWLKQLGCPENLIEQFWQPLCIASTNTDINIASAKIFAAVLKESIFSLANNSDIYIPRTSLHELWPVKAETLLKDRIKHKFINSIMQNQDQTWLVADQVYDKVILATPAHISHRLIAKLNDSESYLQQWPQFRFSAIGTVNLLLEKPWHSEQAMYLLKDNPAQNAWGQWLFDRSITANTKTQQNLLHVVIGNAQKYMGTDLEAIKLGVIEQIKNQSDKPLPKILKHLLVTEKRATFDSVCNLNRPTIKTPWQGLLLAGDWTDTGYPAVLEGAVKSGLQVAQYIHDN